MASSSPSSSSDDLPCVGKLEIAKPKAVGFLCGTLPVLADADFSLTQSALVPSNTKTIEAPRYRMLPTETDLNTLPLLPNNLEKDLFRSDPESDVVSHWESCHLSQNISKKCESLAVYSLSEYGDEIDVVAPTDILKQIFKIPYSKARLSVTVHRIGNTLILNTGPDAEVGEKMFRRQSNQPREVNSSTFRNFAMHSVRAEACDCPPSFFASQENQSSSNALPGHSHSANSQILNHNSSDNRKGRLDHCSDYPKKTQDRLFKGHKKKHKGKKHDPIDISSQVGEKSRGPVQESEKYRRVGNNEFLRVLFWQFHNFRMLLGSNLLMFSNEKYVAVSLHLWDVARQVSPLSWLEAWLDNVMAGVPELAICYHRNGVVQGYELLKTDDIFLLKGISEDGNPAFHPQVVQQTGLSVLRFLQKNCKKDPGAYWLYKSAGEDVIQLFDLCVPPESNSTDEHRINCDSLSSFIQKGRKDSLFSLGTLLYRVAHRLSLSKVSSNKAKCADFFKKCLNFLGKQDNLVVRACAHEQFARFILRCYDELDLTSESFLLEYEVTITDEGDESSVFSVGMFGSGTQDKDPLQVVGNVSSTEEGMGFLRSSSEESNILNPKSNTYIPRNITITGEMGNPVGNISDDGLNNGLEVCESSPSVAQVQTVSDPVSSKLAAIHHVSQAIKSLRWNRQLQSIKDGAKENENSRSQVSYHQTNLSQCTCGDDECIEVCDIREWLTKAKMDHKLWKLVLLLGESYLALGEAYKEDGQLHRALKVVEIACSVYGSMPQHLEDAHFISSMVSDSSSPMNFGEGNKSSFCMDSTNGKDSDNHLLVDQFTPNYLFWSKTWTLVGDIFVDYHRITGKDALVRKERIKSGNETRMSNEVVKEVTRLKKKLARYKQNCSSCSLINCSCQSDRMSSGYSASSSRGDACLPPYSRKHSKKLSMKYSSHAQIGPEDGQFPAKMEGTKQFESGNLRNIGTSTEQIQSLAPVPDKLRECSTNVQIEEQSEKIQNVGFGEAKDSETDSQYAASHAKRIGIFRYLEGLKSEDFEYNLAAAMDCYEMSRKSLGYHADSLELQSVTRKKGWVCNELGRLRLNKGDLRSAELAFRDAIMAFKEVADHTNIILINCNIGHGRRALAEEIVTEMENHMGNSLLRNTYKQSVKKAKVEYMRALKYYEDARTELIVVGDEIDLLLRNELYAQYGNTYLRLGMLLSREDNAEELDASGKHGLSIANIRNKKDNDHHLHISNEEDNETRKCNISATEAFREALSIYESMGELRKQEAAFTHFHLACYHRSSCLKFMDLDLKQAKPAKSDNGNRQKSKWYASLAERHWQKAIDFYGPKTHSTMFLNILLERSALSLDLSSSLHSNMMLESSLSHLFEARNIVREASESNPCSLDPEIHEKFWKRLQFLLKKMVATSISLSSNKSGTSSQSAGANKLEDTAKLKEIYRISLKPNNLGKLNDMYKLWIS